MPRRLILLLPLVALLVGAGPGERLYGQFCASCHATAKAPDLHGVGALAADFYLTTGYMPLPHLGVQPRRERLLLTQPQIHDLVGYIASFGGPPVPKPHPQRGNVSAGMQLFSNHCAGCHQVAAAGGYTTGAIPPPLQDDSPTQIAEAVRIGPYVMPRFTTKAISDRQLDSIIRYVEYTKHPDDRGGWAIGHIGPVPEGLVTWFFAAALLVLVCMVIGKRLRA